VDEFFALAVACKGIPKNKHPVREFKNMRWTLLRRGSRVRGRARGQLGRLLRAKLETARAWALKDLFEHFWTYKSPRHAGDFLAYWTWRALRTWATGVGPAGAGWASTRRGGQTRRRAQCKAE
jgi:hypothetical protein